MPAVGRVSPAGTGVKVSRDGRDSTDGNAAAVSALGRPTYCFGLSELIFVVTGLNFHWVSIRCDVAGLCDGRAASRPVYVS